MSACTTGGTRGLNGKFNVHNRYTWNVLKRSLIIFSYNLFIENLGWNDLNQLIKISDLNYDLSQMIFLVKKSFDLNHEFEQ